MGVEPTWDACTPLTDFEDQGQHRSPLASANTCIKSIYGLTARLIKILKLFPLLLHPF